jgi:hypothetical protein
MGHFGEFGDALWAQCGKFGLALRAIAADLVVGYGGGGCRE